MKRSLILMLILFVTAMAGCSEEPTPTQIASAPDKIGPPASAGIIMRGETAVGLTWVDVDAGLRVVIGADMDEYCAGIVNFDLVDFQNGTLPSGRIVSLMKGGNLQTTVWDFLEFDCSLFTSVSPIASGTSRLMGVDNDLQGTVVRNTNSWGWMAQGMLDAADGGRAQFNGFVRQQFGNDSGPKVVSQINLH